ncbi:hypothetical protein KCU67_g15118, partial [Aureobasidium melanogenum]
LGAATADQSPRYVGSPFTLSACSCSTSTSTTQSFTFNLLKVKGDKAKKNCLAIKGDLQGRKSYYPKLVDNPDLDPFSAVYADTKFDACITFEAGV